MKWRCFALALLAVTAVQAQDERVMGARFQSADVRPFDVSGKKGLYGQNVLLYQESVAAVRTAVLAEFEQVDHTATIRFLPVDGDGFEIGYEGRAGAWTLTCRGREMVTSYGDGRELRVPLRSGWNVVEFRVAVVAGAAREREVAITLNDRLMRLNNQRMALNGELRSVFVMTKENARVVVANGGVEIAPTRRRR